MNTKVHDVTVEVLRVTPKMAERWLNANTENRKLRNGVVESYANDMRNGKWTRCTQAISFYEDGALADGQHRLFALIESDTTQTFTVMRGLARPDGLNVDTGLSRTVVDNGRISGVSDHLSNRLVAVVRGVEIGNQVGVLGRALTMSENVALVEKHREAATWACEHLRPKRTISSGPVTAAIARAWYVEKDKDRLDHFCQVLYSGFADSADDSAAVAMRNWIIERGAAANQSQLWRETFMRTQNAIWYFMRRKPLTVIKSQGSEAYPLK